MSSTYDILYCCKKVHDTVKQLRNNKEHGSDDIWVSAKEKHMLEESKPKRRK
jgi:hypothetical protein